MPPVSYTDTRVPAAGPYASPWAKLCEALERLKPILIDQVMLQMGWPVLGSRLNLRELLAWCFALCLPAGIRLTLSHSGFGKGIA